MHAIELILTLLGAAAASAVVADRLALPRPVFLVVGGAVLAMIPRLPRLEIDPQVLFLLFVPPLLYRGALQTSLRDFRIRLRPIAFLSVVMVIASMVAVAVVVHELIPGFPWPQSFALGAIIAPTDTVAALAVTRRLQAPRTVVTILQGEGLVNDATALIAYRAAVAAAVTGTFAPYALIPTFLMMGTGAVLMGLAVGWCIQQLRARLDDVPVIQNTVSLLTPYVAYMPADHAGLSGVLSVVSAGMYLGWHSPQLLSPATRLQADAMWDMIVFVLEGLIFIIVGLELPAVLHTLHQDGILVLAAEASVVTATVVGVRLALSFPGLYFIHALRKLLRISDIALGWRNVLVVGWAGMRGGESMVIALALPLVGARGAPFAQRELIIFLTFAVILVTLLVQGLSLTRLIRWLGLQEDETLAREEATARAAMARAVLDRLEAARSHSEVPADLLANLSELYAYGLLAVQAPGGKKITPQDRAAYLALRRELIKAQRRALIQSRNTDTIGDEVMRRLQRELDLQTAQLS